MSRTRWAALGMLGLSAVLMLVVFAGTGSAAKSAAKPIVIGAAVDETNFMRFFDGPALAAAQIEAAKINAAGGVDGRKIVFKVQNTQLKPDRTKAAATNLVGQGVDIGWVTCDVDWSTPSATQFINAGKLTVAPCIGTDQMGPKRFGSKGKLAFSFGNVAQDEGSALAALAKKEHWKTAIVVTDKVIVYTQNNCQSFTKKFESQGGKVVKQESFTQGDKTIGSVANRVTNTKADVIVICSITSKDAPTFLSGVRSVGDKRPIISPWSLDGNFWMPKSPKIADNFWVVTYASIYGDDPNPQVRALIAKLKAGGHPPATGGFVTGAAAIDGIVATIKKAGGSTDGSKLASILEGTKNLPTISGKVSFSSQYHSVFGREYRVIQTTKGKPHFKFLIKAQQPLPKLG